MKVLFVTLLIICAFINYNMTLDCYLCGGSFESNCAAGIVAAMMAQHCQNINHYKSLCVAYVSKANEDLSEGFVRGCGYLPEEDPKGICENMKEMGQTDDNCVECPTDYCNL